jgi:Ras homolog gene family, member A
MSEKVLFYRNCLFVNSKKFFFTNWRASRLTLGSHSNQDDELPPYSLPPLKDLDQPYQFNVKVRGENICFSFFDTASPTNYTLIHPDFIILCYDISSRPTLESLETRWKSELVSHFNYDERMPVMVLGLKRDLRREWTPEERTKLKGKTIMPQEGLLVAQQMRCDVYAECSAVTGELFQEVVEDIAKTAMKTLESDSEGKLFGGCTVM